MNPGMWQHYPTQRNAAYLRDIGYHFIGPATGEMACDQWGEGRMVEPEKIFEVARRLLTAKPKKKVLAGKSILVTAGPCREPLDPVRFLSNRSSGKMGYALAEAARDLGARVTLITGPTELPPPADVNIVPVETTRQMYRAVSSRFGRCDCLIMAAAPADFKPAATSAQKIKKATGARKLDLKPTVDILERMGGRKKNQVLVGFALETHDGLANARKKLKAKNLDLIVLNSPRDARSAFEFDTNQVTLVRPGRRPDPWPLLPKSEVAGKVLELIADML
jgi:phosphopantothenoylcysteine decarboxylase/phosphopantothenate--cysteine ligase